MENQSSPPKNNNNNNNNVDCSMVWASPQTKRLENNYFNFRMTGMMSQREDGMVMNKKPKRWKDVHNIFISLFPTAHRRSYKIQTKCKKNQSENPLFSWKPVRIFDPTRRKFDARLGPSGGERGYTGITGKDVSKKNYKKGGKIVFYFSSTVFLSTKQGKPKNINIIRQPLDRPELVHRGIFGPWALPQEGTQLYIQGGGREGPIQPR